MSLFLPSQLSPNFEEVIEGNDLEFRFLVNTNGSEITSYKLEILNENNDAETPDENILYTQRGYFSTPLYNQDEGLITVFYSDIENLLILGHNYRWRVRLYDAQVFNNDEPPAPNVSVDNIQSEALTYIGSGNLVGTTRNVIWLNNPVENIQEEDFVEMYLQSNDFSNDFKPFINDSQTYTKEGTDGLSIIDDGKYCWIPAGVPDINELILPNYQDKLCDGNMYFQIAENIIEGSPIYLDTDCVLTNMDLFITILNSENFKVDENETVYQFGIQVDPSSWPQSWGNVMRREEVYFNFTYYIIEDGEPVAHYFNATLAHDIPVGEDRMLQLYLQYKTETDASIISDMPFNENIEQISLTSSYRSQSLYKVTIDNFYDSSLPNGMYAFRFAFEDGLPSGAQIWFYNSNYPTQLVCRITIAESDNTLAEKKDLRVWYFSINNTKDASFFFASPVYPYIPRQILTSRVIIDNQNNRHFYFGISKKQSLTQWVPSSSTGQRYKYKLVYLDRQQIFGVTSGIGTSSLTKIETDKPFTYNASHGEMVNAPLTNNHFYANKLYIQPIDEFDSKDVGNVYLICSNTLDGLALTHSYNYQNFATLIQYSQQEMESMGAKKIINYVAETGEITLFSNLDDIPDLFSLYQIFTIDKTLSDYAINPKYKILSGSPIYMKNGVRYLENTVKTPSSFKSFPYYLGGKAVYQLGHSPTYIYNEGFNETDKIIDGTYLRGNSSMAVYSNHFDNVARWQETDNSYQMLTYKMFVQPNNALKEDYYAPCVLNLYKTFDQDTENIYGYATNSFIQSEYNKYLSIDHLDESQYLITYTTYNPILNASTYQVKNTVVLPQSGNNYYHYYIVLNINGQLEEGDTCVACLQYGFSGSGNLGDDIWFRDKDGTPIGRTPLWTPDRSSYPPGLYQIKITPKEDALYHVELSDEWDYEETPYNTRDLNKMIFPQTPYKLYSYFVDSIPEQFFYYRAKREVELEFSEAFTGESDVIRPGDILWEDAYNFAAIPENIRDKDIKEVDETIVGGTVAWNQSFRLRDTDKGQIKTVDGIMFLYNNDDTVQILGDQRTTGAVFASINTFSSFQSNHVIVLLGCPKNGSANSYYLQYGDANISLKDYGNGACARVSDGSSSSGGVNINLSSNYSITRGLVFKPQLFDLTKMFGSIIADYILDLEQNHTGAGIEWFRKLFPKDYYPYNAGELMSVNTSAHKTVGFNQFDGELELGDIYQSSGENVDATQKLRSKNYIPCLPSARYFYKTDNKWASFLFYGAAKNYLGQDTAQGVNPNESFITPANAYYMRFVQQNNIQADICINLSLDGERDGEYESYEEHVYPLDADLELRGIPKLDENNNLYYDGDVYESDGTVTRKYGIVDLGTLGWTSNSSTHVGQFYAPLTIRSKTSYGTNHICPRYITSASGAYHATLDKSISITMSNIWIYDSSYGSNATALQSSLSGVYLVYEVEISSTENADPFVNPQIVNDFGTGEYVDERTVPVPVGHITRDYTKKLIVRDAKITAKLTDTSQVPFATPNIKSYRYYLYGKLDGQEKRLLEDSGLLYDGKMTYTFYGFDSIYSKSYQATYAPMKEKGKILYYLDFVCEDEYGYIEKKTSGFYATYSSQWLDLNDAKIQGKVDCLTQSANLSAHSTSNFQNWSLYKNKYNDFYETYLGTYDLDPELHIQDYQIKNGEAYQYTLWKMKEYDVLNNRYIYGVYNTIGAIRAYWQDWSLCDLVYDYENQMYIPGDTVFLFQKNINAGGINKNISRVQYETLSRYNRILSNSLKYDSGNLTCLFGDFKVAQKMNNNMPIVTIYGTVPIIDNQTKEKSFLQIINSQDISIAESFFEQNGLYPGMDNIYLRASYKDAILYVEDLGLYYSRKYTQQWVEMQSMYQFVSDVEKIAAFQNCLANKQKKLLKAPNGNAWIVAISGGLSKDVDWKSSQYPTNISFDWQEVEDINSVNILKW